MNYFEYAEETLIQVEPDGRRMLHVDISPKKSCICNCIICSRGQTELQNEWRDFGPVEDSLKELGERIDREKPDFVQVYGKGEPLTNVRVGEVIDFIHSKGLPVRLLTNCYLLGIGKHMEYACKCDEVVAAFGITTEEDFQKLHRPLPGMTAAEQTESMLNFSRNYKGKLTLRVFLAKGFNDSDEKVASLKAVIDQMNYDKLWVATTPKLTVDAERVDEIRRMLSSADVM